MINELMHARQFASAERELRRLVEEVPEHADTKALLAFCWTECGRLDDAQALIESLVSDNLESHICWHVMGHVVGAE